MTPTLFGQWALVREWGRIGQAGAVRENWIESESAASAAGTKPFTHWLRVYLCWRLFHRSPGDAREREPVKARLEAIALGMHPARVTPPPRQTPVAEIGWGEMERLLARFAELNPAYESGRVQPAVQREDLLTRSGLLLPRTGDRAAFYHLSFQEFSRAERIARTTYDPQALEQVFGKRRAVPEWRPTLLFLFAAVSICRPDLQLP